MFIILADGSCSGNPGPVKIGVVIWHRKPGKGRIVMPTHTISKWCGAGTNNEAEYDSIIEGLQYAIDEKITGEDINVYCDAKVIINQINKKYSVISENLIEYNNTVAGKVKVLESRQNKVTFTWIPRQLTVLADKESKRRLLNG